MFWIIFGVVLGPINPPKTVFLAVYPCRKQSDYLHNHAHSYTNGTIAFVLFAHHWLASSCMGALWGVGNRAIHFCAVHKLIARLPLMVKYRRIQVYNNLAYCSKLLYTSNQGEYWATC